MELRVLAEKIINEFDLQEIRSNKQMFLWQMILSCPINSIYGGKGNSLLTSFISRHQCSGPKWNSPNNNKCSQCYSKGEKKHGGLCHVRELTKHFSIS